ncbi:hypothetical protein GCM10020229_23540 [Kitasatospora albolonga]|uniref:hypothetical protein n=1 Tax=Kitasatospora albolonga TaxID=68173 RepID=UPI0031E60F4F
MIKGVSAADGEPDAMVLAGYFVAVPASLNGSAVPRRPGLTTASDCLVDRLPEDGDWFAGPSEALAACRSVPVPEGARLHALLVPADHVDGFAADVVTAGTDEPVLLAHLGRRTGLPAAEPAGRELGWEVLGYDHGLLHTWLCNDLHGDGVRELGVTTDPDRVLLPDRESAVRVAAWANARTDTKPVTWFPAALVEWDTPIEGRPGPDPSEAPVPPVTPPWWRRIL